MPSKKQKTNEQEPDSTFLFKIVLYIILASVWVKFQTPIDISFTELYGVPVGLLVGLIVARHDRFQIDRKIEYVVLIVMTVLTYFIPAGIVL